MMCQMGTPLETLEQIFKLTIEIMKRCVDIMSDLIDENQSNLIDELEEDIPNMSRNEIIITAREMSFEFLDDANQVSEEYPIFKSILMSKNIDEAFKKNGNKCTLLSNVWHGDAYDNKHENEGLRELKRDLTKQFDEIATENIKTSIREYFDKKVIKNSTL
jgi:hypothetical protein